MVVHVRHIRDHTVVRVLCMPTDIVDNETASGRLKPLSRAIGSLLLGRILFDMP